jgi:thioesterase domain-containing protein
VHCPLLFFSASQNPPSMAEKVETWRRFVEGPIEAMEVDCDHRHMMLPHPVARMGPAISAQLARVINDHRASIV